jgi:hypothetical protein
MKHLLSGLVVVLISVSAFATQRTPLATIPGPLGANTNINPAVAAQDGILAIAYAYVSSVVYLYAIPNWDKPIATLTVSDQSQFIDTIGIQNNYIAVATTSPSPNYYGSVYVFAKPASGWASESETAVLSPSNPRVDDGFGDGVAAWGNTLIVGAFGAGYIFIEPQNGWVDATENAQLTSTSGPNGFGGNVGLTGTVGSNGSVAVVGAYNGAYVFLEPEGGWQNMTQTAVLSGTGGSVAVGSSTIADGSGPQGDPISIFIEPEGGWQNASTPTYTASAHGGVYLEYPALSQDGAILVSGFGSSYRKKGDWDEAYLWHASKDFGSSPITLSTSGLSTALEAATVTKDYAFAWDIFGNVFVFDGK